MTWPGLSDGGRFCKKIFRCGRGFRCRRGTQSWISDTQTMGLYSTLLFVVIALWVYVPA
jgi:hypothetical protein